MALDTLDKKGRGVTLALQDRLPLHIDRSIWRKETPEILETLDYQASLDLEETKVCPVCQAVRDCLDFLVLQIKVKDSLGSQDFLDSPDSLATLDRKENQESWDSLVRLDLGGMMVYLVSLAIPENLGAQEEKVSLENPMGILEVLGQKDGQASQEYQVVVEMMVLLVTMVSRALLVSLESKVVLENLVDLESEDLRVSRGQRGRLVSLEGVD